MKKFCGYVATLCFVFSGLPAAIEAVQFQKCTTPMGTLILWTIGEISILIYMWRKDLLLMINYILNLTFLSVIWFVYFKELLG